MKRKPKIGKRAKSRKYNELRQLQSEANKMLYGSKEWLGIDHRARKKALERKRLFFAKRGLKNPSRLSFKNLTTADIASYENLLRSISESTYLNKEKYEEFKESQKGIWEDHFDTWEEFNAFTESDVFNMLIELGLDPSALYLYIQEYLDGGYDIDTFIDQSKEFIERYKEGDYTIDDYFLFMEDRGNNV